ncbi:group II intron maturase-specific domain-containing protein [Streptomyces sp. NPDC051976]|uniref:group II intron maturase-specific domain-containing protein n=1 Tax=Streptomyces sp. NPDC051976 TaxID=3154947 RepID=UPI0034495287
MEELAQRINPIVAGWMQYYGRFYRSALYPLLMCINAYLVRWLRNTYRRFRAMRKAIAALRHPLSARTRLHSLPMLQINPKVLGRLEELENRPTRPPPAV